MSQSVSVSLSLPPTQSKSLCACPSLCHCQWHSATQMKGPADKSLIFLPAYLFVTVSVTLSDLPPKANSADTTFVFLPAYLFVTVSVTLSDLPPKANSADTTFVFLLAYLCHYQCHSVPQTENPADHTFVFLCVSVSLEQSKPCCRLSYCMQQPSFVWSVSLTDSPQQQDI